jgi:hypothetical protein
MPAGSLFPFAIGKTVADLTQSGITIPIGGSYGGGQWTSLKDPSGNVSQLMASPTGNPSTLTAGVGGIDGDNIWIVADSTPYSSPLLAAMVGQDVLVPVVNIPLNGTVNASTPIYAFIGFHIVSAPGSYIQGYFLNNFYVGWSGPAGPNYGAHAPSKLVQ